MQAIAVGGLLVVVCLAAVQQHGKGDLPSPGDQRAVVDAVLDALHDAAARADAERYFACFDSEAVFLGTDPAERWTFAAFREYAANRFATGTGWTYRVTDRFTSLSPDGRAAWFDERLANDTYGECRGTGVLLRREDGWRIVQYNLTIPIPNDLAGRVVEMIRTRR
jgi:hypothetical protein